jgi:hypothetical protein
MTPEISQRTITAAEVAGAASCKKCGCSEPRKELWGVDAYWITTADARNVKFWICKACFEAERITDLWYLESKTDATDGTLGTYVHPDDLAKLSGTIAAAIVKARTEGEK